ncbi:hypothetical protein BIU98_14840 [Curtobacterium sp. MMLR14_010]|uniref:hypothetical protein n=1 Tax=Curtobacterium sp. MMLR14_010 TaxID=1898743 RepID=UPI0008DDCD44|nr:hypothetical protein [Curtobacterium sp. MMLR14_010]OII38149.1 hypothetical protein BIU98_14840 [Curtobacterium sp. MMLR14_010]
MFRLGWQVFRAQFADAVSVDRFRRALRIGVLAAVVAAVVMVVTEASSHWASTSTGLTVVVIVLLSVATGLLALACCPFAQPLDPAATINGRQVRPDTARTVRTSVKPYLQRKPPAVDPEDREAVLVDTALLRRGLVLDLTRWGPCLGAGLLAAVAAWTAGAIPAYILLYFVPWSVGMLDRVRELGRAERARRAAAALPPHDAATPAGRDSLPRTDRGPATANSVRMTETRPGD